MGFYDLLIQIHLESYVISRTMTKHEYVVPLVERLRSNRLSRHQALMRQGHFPNRDELVSVRPSMQRDALIRSESQRALLVPPKCDLGSVKTFVLSAFAEAVRLSTMHVRDPIGGSVSFLFV